MRIKKLELIGFKSFKDRTVIQFDAGITGIVGPNGCGKSNIIDALIWVMGEQSAKHLRGSSMEDVIFGGAEGHPASGFAEVSLVLENEGGPFPAKYSHLTEVQITRRLSRSGESDYLINREAARLRDIQEVFMDTGAGAKGFSIIEQGAIGKIITAKPDDRRTLIEEAAGITKFKVRKRESQRKLQATDQNLVRLNDIVGELKRQIDSLQRQAKKAERYREVKQEIEKLELKLASEKFRELNAILNDSESILVESEDQEGQVKTQVESLAAKLEELKLSLLEREKNLETAQAIFHDFQLQVQKKESEIQRLGFEVEQAQRQEIMQDSLRSDLLKKQKDYEASKAQLYQTLSETTEILEGANARFDAIKLEVEEAESKTQELDDDLTTKRRELMTLGQGETQFKLQIENANEKIQELEQRLRDAAGVAGEIDQKLQVAQNRKNELITQNSTQVSSLAEVNVDREAKSSQKLDKELDIEQSERELTAMRSQLTEVAGKLYGLENLQQGFEGFEEGVKALLLWRRSEIEKHPDGGLSSFRPVTEIIEVPENLELAMEAALGTRIQSVITTDSADLKNAVGFLKNQQSGRGLFASKEWMSERGHTLAAQSDELWQKATAEDGDLSKGLRLVDSVKANQEYAPLIKSWLGRVVVVDTLEEALEGSKKHAEFTYVTFDGDVVEASGVVIGGAKEAADSGALKRKREVRELSLKKQELSAKAALIEEVIRKQKEELSTLSTEMEVLSDKKRKLEIEVEHGGREIERANIEIDQVTRAVERQAKEVTQLTEQVNSTQAKIADWQQRLAEILARKVELETHCQSLEVEYLSERDRLDELKDKSTNAQVEFVEKKERNDAAKRQLETVERDLSEVTERLGSMIEQSEKNRESATDHEIALRETRTLLHQLIDEAQAQQLRVSSLKNDFETLSSEIRSKDSELSQLRSSHSEWLTRLNDSKFKAEQARMNLANIREQILEKYVLELEQIEAQYCIDESETLDLLKEKLEELKDRARKMGEVNLSSITEYEEVSARYEFLIKQQQDLNDAKEQLRKVIDRINRICSRRFKETFEAVNERFQRVFPVLFGGGEAQLILIENEVSGEMGIDIIAKPPGKKPQSVTLLSGGEKALTAVSLIFSIFLVKPSPFCLLDEVDAPLDDANVYRFGDLVREMAKRSQIIVITHNKHTMEINEKLYGVTQEERGVSKMVSVSLQQAQEVIA
ncbi:MAG: chromosome segregation protein SMC [Bdellovibrionales bacterium CG10_big_fil_rev_8_21_14_0_10_45_34]|nr:MAG: chromosome segregation protein SMC [Bdellovibrionales bacterium CG10_big_fil_rev_8_21_14_0_10_45_34]